jgi:hypothetical protein
MQLIKNQIKKILIFMGLRNPAIGIKISGEQKVEILLSYKDKMNIFIETGTNQGDTINAMINSFKEIYSIEFDIEKFNKAVKRFAGIEKLHLYHGDSREKIYEVMAVIKGPSLIWLDAYGSPFDLDNSPVREELDAIFKHYIKGHVILIDDARHFTIRDLREINNIARSYEYNYIIDKGIIRLIPNINKK